MSKIGRKPIEIGDVSVEIKGQEIHYKGSKASGVYILPDDLSAQLDGKKLMVTARKLTGDTHRIWGLHRALLANCIQGAAVGFTKQIKINGLGYKAVLSGNKVIFSLGYSHKIEFPLPKNVSLEIDKTGQLLTFGSVDRSLLGHVCGMVRSLRPPEPYKGTGIKLVSEVIMRKAGKTKTS